jgi:uncharacterized damage-inducible protein DinB
MRILSTTILLAVFGVSPSFAQSAPGNPISDAIRQDWARAARNVRESAEQMPAEQYGFKPVDSVRTFGQVLGHVAGVNYLYCGAASGDTTPREEDAIEKAATTKDALVKALGESLAYCDKAFAALTDRSAADQVDMPFGGGKGARVGMLLGNTTHVNEHYGNLVTYFRIKGMVPPSSKGQ